MKNKLIDLVDDVKETVDKGMDKIDVNAIKDKAGDIKDIIDKKTDDLKRS